MLLPIGNKCTPVYKIDCWKNSLVPYCCWKHSVVLYCCGRSTLVQYYCCRYSLVQYCFGRYSLVPYCCRCSLVLYRCCRSSFVLYCFCRYSLVLYCFCRYCFVQYCCRYRYCTATRSLVSYYDAVDSILWYCTAGVDDSSARLLHNLVKINSNRDNVNFFYGRLTFY